MFLYQLPVWFPGWVFFMVMAGGLVPPIGRWRRPGRDAGLAWGVAGSSRWCRSRRSSSMAATRCPAPVPFACLALGLACIEPGPRAITASAASAADAHFGSPSHSGSHSGHSSRSANPAPEADSASENGG